MGTKDKDFIDEGIKFMQKAHEVCVEADREYIYDCPICSGTVHATKSSYRGRHHAFCEKCKVVLRE